MARSQGGANPQPAAGHYFERAYDDVKRFASYWHQIDLAVRHAPRSILEVGIGNGFLSDYLRRAGVPPTRLDVDPALHPDVVAALPRLPFPDGSFDTVLCYEVLEHLPFALFAPSVRELRRVARRSVALSLPDYQRYLKIDSKLSKVWSIHFVVTLPRLVLPAQPGDSEHCWEIGKRGTRQRRVLAELAGAGLTVRRHFRPLETPYHHFFDLSKA